MLDQGVHTSFPVIADNGPGGRATGVPHARWLRISVTRGGRVVVQVCLLSYAVLSLGDLVPDDEHSVRAWLD